jgi:hypothetical protein
MYADAIRIDANGATMALTPEMMGHLLHMADEQIAGDAELLQDCLEGRETRHDHRVVGARLDFVRSLAAGLRSSRALAAK